MKLGLNFLSNSISDQLMKLNLSCRSTITPSSKAYVHSAHYGLAQSPYPFTSCSYSACPYLGVRAHHRTTAPNPPPNLLATSKP